jgi:hypothetical protein
MAFIFKDASGHIVKLITPGNLTEDMEIDVTLTGTIPPDASIDDLADVDTLTNPPQKGQVLKWDGSHWVPKPEPFDLHFNTDASDGQTDFHLKDDSTGHDIKARTIRVFRDGIKIKDSEYSLIQHTTYTTVRLDNPCSDNEWISIEIIETYF